MNQHDTLTLEQIVDNFLDGFELEGETEDGREASYAPSETEQGMIKYAFYGLLEDDDFKAWNRRAALATPAQAQQSEQWAGQANIESAFNACMHKEYCLGLKAQAQQAGEVVAAEFFAYHPDMGVEFFKTQREAVACTDANLDYERDGAIDHGEWDDTAAERTCWGVVMQRGKAVQSGVSDDGVAQFDYVLADTTPPAPAQPVPNWREPHPPSRLCMCPSCIPSFDERFDPVAQPVQGVPLTRQDVNKIMADAGWQNSGIRQADLDKVCRVVDLVEKRSGIQPEAQQPAGDVAIKAARYDWLLEKIPAQIAEGVIGRIDVTDEEIEDAIDAALASLARKGEWA